MNKTDTTKNYLPQQQQARHLLETQLIEHLRRKLVFSEDEKTGDDKKCLS